MEAALRRYSVLSEGATILVQVEVEGGGGGFQHSLLQQ